MGAEIRIGDRVIAQDALKLDAARVASALAELGVKHGERVAIVLRNDPDFQLLTTACRSPSTGTGAAPSYATS
jgi:acyl-coenzyme A synthetase/AMP-(fatty) acid ligase